MIKACDPVPATLAAQCREQAGMEVEDAREKPKKPVELRSEYAPAMAYSHVLHLQDTDKKTARKLRQVHVKTEENLVDQAEASRKKNLGLSTPQSRSV